jgi:branched-chain amino acid transport system ATP-binding protein
MLRVDGLEVGYKDLQVVWGISFEVPERSVVGILGHNGAGKTTTLLALCGLLPVKAGSVWFRDESLVGMRPHDIVELGVVMVPEERSTFATLTVEENLELGAYAHRARDAADRTRAEVLEIFPRLAERRSQRVATLSGGERQMLAIGKALMARPELLILDEPSLGLAPIVVEQMFDVLERIRESGVSVLMVEQNVGLTLDIVDHAYIVELGAIVAEGTGSELATDPRIAGATLGL